MAYIDDEVRDQGLDWGQTNGVRLRICSTDPGGTYATATGNQLAVETVTCTSAANYTPTDGRQCWTALEPGAAGPSDEDLQRMADPRIADAMPEVLLRTRPHMGASGVDRLSGRVVVSALVDPTGRVVQACLAESAESELDEVAIASVFQWEFKPGTKGGVSSQNRRYVVARKKPHQQSRPCP